MASEDRSAAHRVRLYLSLKEQPYAFDVFQALRRIECVNADQPRLGESARPKDDPVRLGQEPSLNFAGAALARFDTDGGNRRPRLLGYYFGLLGPNGPLPLHLTEHVYDRARNARDTTLSSFLDLFHHRMLSLFYRAWANSSPTVSFDRPRADRFGTYLGSLFGLGTASLRDRDAMPDLAKLHFTGRLACQARHPDGLQAMIGEFFRVAVEIREFLGEWIVIPESSRCFLGRSPESGQLGRTAVAGAQAWSGQHKIGIVLGPLAYGDFQRFLPGGESLARLVALVRNYIGDELAWDLKLVLKKDEVPEINLGQSGRLGWTTWLGDWSFDRDADDLSLTPSLRAAQ
ncbi:MAG: type VI secretion system baseplate subunit TssG [Kiloniellales bacterium]|nr:type VI secretion system baseplate subunit TssG [Kiloniellales bacterium]